MRNIPFRWLLPLAHATIDVVVLCIWLWHSQNVPSNQKGSLWHPALFVQESVVEWDPKYDVVPPAGFTFLESGTLPAAFVSGWVRPEASFQRRGKLWDPVWFAIHEAVAMLVWLALGMVTDAAGQGFQRVMWTYLASRAAFAPFTAINEVARLGALLQTLFWLGLVLFGIGYLAIRGIARLRTAEGRP
jgi:hypothetical protein